MILDMVLMKSDLEGKAVSMNRTVGCGSADDALHNSSRPMQHPLISPEGKRLGMNQAATPAKEFCSLD